MWLTFTICVFTLPFDGNERKEGRKEIYEKKKIRIIKRVLVFFIYLIDKKKIK